MSDERRITSSCSGSGPRRGLSSAGPSGPDSLVAPQTGLVDKIRPSGLFGTMRRPALMLIALLSFSPPAGALVGGAEVVRGTGAGRHIVMIISTRGSLCTGTAIARDLVLTGG